MVWQPILLSQSLHYPWCRFLIFAETCAILRGLLSQEKGSISSRISEKKKKKKDRNIQLGMRKAIANTSSFYFDLLHFVIIVTKGLCSDVRIFRNKLIYFLATTSRFADQTVCAPYLYVTACTSVSLYKSEHVWKKNRVLMSARWHRCRKCIGAKNVFVSHVQREENWRRSNPRLM